MRVGRGMRVEVWYACVCGGYAVVVVWVSVPPVSPTISSNLPRWVREWRVCVYVCVHEGVCVCVRVSAATHGCYDSHKGVSLLDTCLCLCDGV